MNPRIPPCSPPSRNSAAAEGACREEEGALRRPDPGEGPSHHERNGPREPGTLDQPRELEDRMDFSTLGITGDAIEAGGMMLSSEDGASQVRLTITSDPASIPAETGQEVPELIIIPDECAGMHGTWTAQEFGQPEPARVWSVTELEKEKSSGVRSAKVYSRQPCTYLGLRAK